MGRKDEEETITFFYNTLLYLSISFPFFCGSFFNIFTVSSHKKGGSFPLARFQTDRSLHTLWEKENICLTLVKMRQGVQYIGVSPG